MRLHRIIVPFAIMSILVGALIGAAGCSEDKSDEQVIADALARSLDGYKNHDAEALSWFAEDMDLDELSVFSRRERIRPHVSRGASTTSSTMWSSRAIRLGRP